MKSIEIKVKSRKETGKKATKKLRNDGNVPCVVYGAKKDNAHFYAQELDFRDLVYTPNSYIVELDIDGNKEKAIMKDLQFHPVTDKINHIDFIRVEDDKPVKIEVPVRVEGVSPGVLAGGVLKIAKRKVLVSALLKDLPDFITIDISKLNIGSSVKVEEVEEEGLTLLENPKSVVVGVRTTRVVELDEDLEGAEEGEEATEEGEETKTEE